MQVYSRKGLCILLGACLQEPPIFQSLERAVAGVLSLCLLRELQTAETVCESL